MEEDSLKRIHELANHDDNQYQPYKHEEEMMSEDINYRYFVLLKNKSKYSYKKT
jgi:hypothetical protein